MQIEKKYEQWKSITESDFVTLFIKTWFTFIATLRELNPGVSVFAEDGMPRGDKPFLNAYKCGIMSIVQKRMETDEMLQELFKLYPFAMKKVMEVFPQYFFQTFYKVNREFKYVDEDFQKDNDDNLKERYHVSIQIRDQWLIKVSIGLSGYYQKEGYKKIPYNEKIKFNIDTRELFQQTIETIKSNSEIDELSILKELYDRILKKITAKIQNKDYTNQYNKTINKKIKTQLERIFAGIRLNIEKNYRFPNEIEGIYDINTFAIFKQMPYNLFYKSFTGGLTNKDKPFYDRLLKTDGIEWFANFVYALRNALFHEIISPLDEDWQIIFKSAYLVLKRISDVCIDTIYSIYSLNITDNNPIIEFITSNTIDCIDNLADYVEIMDISKISLACFEIYNAKINTTGVVKLKVKLQNGEADDFQEGTGEIYSEEPISVNFNATLYDNLEIVETQGGQKDIKFSIS